MDTEPIVSGSIVNSIVNGSLWVARFSFNQGSMFIGTAGSPRAQDLAEDMEAVKAQTQKIVEEMKVCSIASSHTRLTLALFHI